MKLKRLAILSALVFASMAFFATLAQAQLELGEATFDSTMQDRLVIVNFWAEGYVPSRTFVPVFKSVAGLLHSEVLFAGVDLGTNTAFIKRFSIRHIPYTVAIRKGKVVEEYRGDSSLIDFRAWCLAQVEGKGDSGPTSSQAAPAATESANRGAIALGDKDFLASTKGKLAIVDFWAVWCRPCKRFEPTFLKVAKDFSDKVLFARVDVDSSPNLSTAYQVKLIPYVVAISGDGGVIEEYKGDQTEDDLSQWCLRMIEKR